MPTITVKDGTRNAHGPGDRVQCNDSRGRLRKSFGREWRSSILKTHSVRPPSYRFYQGGPTRRVPLTMARLDGRQ